MQKLLCVTMLLLTVGVEKSLQAIDAKILKHFQNYHHAYYMLNKNDWQNYLSRDILNDTTFNAEMSFQNFEKYGSTLNDGLILEKNKIGIMTSNFFDTVSNITFLSLKNNKIQKIEVGSFINLKNLMLLQMKDNKLQELPSNMLSYLDALQFLTIDENNLESLPADIFVKNVNLLLISLNGNSFRSLPEGLFKNNKKLIKVNLQNVTTLTSLPNGLFSNKTKLQYVLLNNCNLTILPENLFQGSVNLLHIFLNHNFLHTLPTKLFQGLENLQLLRLNDNRLQILSNNVFDSCTNLEELNLSGNKIVTINWSIFTELKSLDTLNLNRNQITNFIMESLLPSKSVKDIDLSYNKISDLNSNFSIFMQSLFSKYQNLEVLDLSHNKLRLKSKGWIKNLPPTLFVLDLAHNEITLLTGEDLNIQHQNFILTLSDNNLTDIDLHNYQDSHHKILLNIENNPLHCSCHLYDVLQYSNDSLNQLTGRKLHVLTGSSKCFGSDEYKDILLSDINLEEYKCVPHKKEIDDYEMCPHMCDLQRRPADKSLLVDCSNRNLTYAPEKLCSLNLPNSSTVLDLTGNRIKHFPNLHQVGYDKVTSLILSRNEISTIPEDIFFSTALEILKLNSNQIKMLSTEVIKKISTGVQSIHLGNNPWQCNCEVFHFQKFLLTGNVTEDVDSIICENSISLLKNITVHKLCPLENFLLITLVFIIIGAFAFLFYYYRKQIKFWLYINNRCLWFVTERELDNDKFYDAFISYSDKDEEFVISELVTNLQEGPRSFKLRLHFRDWFAGERMSAQIINSTQNSKRTIVVLSPNFIECNWGKLEFKNAFKQGLEEGRSRLIFILYGNIGSFVKLDLDLQNYLKNSTLINWGDSLFWDKLYYALPHKSDVLTKSSNSTDMDGIFLV